MTTVEPLTGISGHYGGSFIFNLDFNCVLYKRLLSALESSGLHCNNESIVILLCSILPKHAVIDITSKDVNLAALDGAKVAVNGKPLINSITLHHNDR